MSTINLSNRPRRHILLAVALIPALTALFTSSSAVAADRAAGTWQLTSFANIRLLTYYLYKDGRGVTFPALGVNAGLMLTSADKPLAAGLFADYELSTLSEQTNIRLGGGWVSYRFGRWELSTVAGHYASHEVNGLWMYSNKLQFEPRHGHKIGLEAIGTMSGGDPALQLVYETNVSQRLALSLVVGLGSDPLQDLGASTKFVWNLR